MKNFVLILSLLLAIGCVQKRTQQMNAPITDASMLEMPKTPVKLVYFVNYPEGGKDAYLEWVSSIVPTLQAPKEIHRIRSYDNVDQTMSPQRLVEFEFDSFLDMATYLNRPEIVKIVEDLPNYAIDVTVHTFIQRSDYAKGQKGKWTAKRVFLVNYPLGGKQAYLAWIKSISAPLGEIPQLKASTSYANYYGETPHRLAEHEFADLEGVTAYDELEYVKMLRAELDVRTESWSQHTFELRSDYINESR